MSWIRDKLRRGVQFGRGLLRGLFADESQGSIAQKSVRGGGWVFAGLTATRFLQVVKTAILARLLVPEDFGAMRLAVVAIAAAKVFTQLGVHSALVQRPMVSQKHLETAWTMDMARYVIMFAFTLSVAGPIAAFYDTPRLAPIIRLASLQFLFMGLSNNAGMAMLSREMQFRRKQIYELILNISAVAFTLAMAFWLRTVWALAWAQVYYGVGEFIGSYIVHPFRPHFRFYVSEARQLFRFGKHILVGGILGFLRRSLASLLLGKLLGTEALGYFSLAHSLVLTPVAVITPIFGQVLYPAFSRLQEKTEVLRRAFVRAMGLGFLLLSPVLVGIAVTAAPLVLVLYGERYAPVAPLVAVLCAAQLFMFWQIPGQSLLRARDRQVLNNIAEVLYLAVLVGTMFPLTARYKVIGVVLAMIIATVAQAAFLSLLVRSEIDLSLRQLVSAVSRPVAASGLMGLCVWTFPHLFPLSAFVSLIVMVLSGIVLYLVLSAILNPSAFRNVLSMLRTAAGA